jgi:2-methylcitrate dehydratase PrpD
MSVTRTLADFIAGFPADRIPVEAFEVATRAVLDTLGVALAGSVEPPATLSARLAPDMPGGTVLWGQNRRTSPAYAALVNGAAAHALDYDDVQHTLRGHPSAPVVPALFAAAEATGCSGQDLLAAYVIADEVAGRLGEAIGAPHYIAGWHNTSTLGALAAAAGCARLLGLGPEDTCRALGIAASMASGLKKNFGTMTKPLHAGLAARVGYEAASLAGLGFTADEAIFDGPLGFLSVYSAGGAVNSDALVRGLGDRWQVLDPGIAVKIYPCCAETHRALDAIFLLLAETPFQPEEVEVIEALVSPVGTPLIHTSPKTGLEGKFSMEYCLAAAVLDRKINLATFTDPMVNRPEARSLMARVRRVWHDSLPVGSGLQDDLRSGTDVPLVKVYLKDGRVLARRVEEPKGDPKNPVTWDELAGKFRDCAGRVLNAGAVDRLVELVRNLRHLPDLRELSGLLAGAPEPVKEAAR